MNQPSNDRTLRGAIQAIKAAWNDELAVGCTGCSGLGCSDCGNNGYVLAGFRWRRPRS